MKTDRFYPKWRGSSCKRSRCPAASLLKKEEIKYKQNYMTISFIYSGT